MRVVLRVRILTPEGAVLKCLMDKPMNALELKKCTDYSTATIYRSLKDLMYSNLIKESNGKFELTKKGIELFWNTIIPNSLKSLTEIPPSKMIDLSLRLLRCILEFGLTKDLVQHLARYDPSLLDELMKLLPKEVVVSV